MLLSGKPSEDTAVRAARSSAGQPPGIGVWGPWVTSEHVMTGDGRGDGRGMVAVWVGEDFGMGDVVGEGVGLPQPHTARARMIRISLFMSSLSLAANLGQRSEPARRAFALV